MFWFGEPWPSAELRASVCEDDRYRIETPIGEVCILCKEEILRKDRGLQYAFIIDVDGGKLTPSHAPYAHIECHFRSIAGNLAHWQGKCHYIGQCNDESTKTYREESIEVWREVCLD